MNTYSQDDIHRGMMGQRSRSAAPSGRYRGRSQSPTDHRSSSPPEHSSILYSHEYAHKRYEISFGSFWHSPHYGLRNSLIMVLPLHPRFSRSATATPTGSPKKRQLPQIPAALKERVAQDLEERARFMRHRNRQARMIYRETEMGSEFLIPLFKIYKYFKQ